MFVHLHNHTEYSLLDGGCRIDELVARAVELGMPAIAITDHGNMHGVIEFYLAAKKAGIKPIIGLEAYIAPGHRTDKTQQSAKDNSNHLVLLARNMDGYRNLMKLCTIGHLEGFYYRPRIDREVLEKHSEGLIGMTACLKGEIPNLVLQGKEEEAGEYIEYYKNLFGEGNFFLELQNHGIEHELKFLQVAPRLAEKYSVPLVATNDIHYLKEEDAFAHEVLVCLGTGKTLADENRMKFSGIPLHFRTEEEMHELFSGFPGALENTVRIADQCNLELKFDKNHYPVYETDDGTPLKDFLRQLCLEGVERRYKNRPIPEKLHEQIDYELKVIDERGLTAYILIVWDFINYAKEHGIPVGPGRGSAVGSLICYLTGISDLDPLQYGLFFERFINPERPSFPDIDVDICRDRRGDVIEYVRRKYGDSKVAQIITFGTLGAKMVIRDVGRVLGYSYGDCDRIAKLIPSGPKVTLSSALEADPDLKKAYETEPDVKEIIDIGFRLEGLSRNSSTHAAGVVICDQELTNFVPLCRGNGDDIITQFSMKIVDKVGLLKMDFLGLKNLTIIDHAVGIIKQRHGIDLNMSDIPVDDQKTLDLLNRAETVGLFQLESSGMTDLAKKMHIDRFEDIMAMIALFRPGPMEMIGDFIKRKQEHATIQYEHPVLEPVLRETHGIFVYQEQVMQAANVMAGYSLGESDILRRAMGKKDPAEMAKQRERFLKGAAERKINKRTAAKVFDLMEKFAGYGFNKSHSAAYAFIVYQTAYLKANYTVEYMAALLSNEMGSTDSIAKYIKECERLGIGILPPDVIESEERFTVVENGIRFGLGAVKNVGLSAIEHIVEKRKAHGQYKTFMQFASDMDGRVVNKKVVESLVKCGAFDSMGYNRSQLLKALDDGILDTAAKRQADKAKGQGSLFDQPVQGSEDPALEPDLPDAPEFPPKKLLSFEKELIGFYVTGHPLNDFRTRIREANCVSLDEVGSLVDRSKVRVAALISSVRFTVKKKTGEKMAILSVEDTGMGMEALVFPETYAKFGQSISQDDPFLFVATVSRREEQAKLVIDEIYPLAEVDESRIKELEKTFNGKKTIVRNNQPRRFEKWKLAAAAPAPRRSNGYLRITVNTGQVKETELEELRAILEGYPGSKPVVLVFPSDSDSIRLQSELMVADDEELLDIIKGKAYVVDCAS